MADDQDKNKKQEEDLNKTLRKIKEGEFLLKQKGADFIQNKVIKNNLNNLIEINNEELTQADENLKNASAISNINLLDQTNKDETINKVRQSLEEYNRLRLIQDLYNEYALKNGLDLIKNIFEEDLNKIVNYQDFIRTLTPDDLKNVMRKREENGNSTEEKSNFKKDIPTNNAILPNAQYPTETEIDLSNPINNKRKEELYSLYNAYALKNGLDAINNISLLNDAKNLANIIDALSSLPPNQLEDLYPKDNMNNDIVDSQRKKNLLSELINTTRRGKSNTPQQPEVLKEQISNKIPQTSSDDDKLSNPKIAPDKISEPLPQMPRSDIQKRKNQFGDKTPTDGTKKTKKKKSKIEELAKEELIGKTKNVATDALKTFFGPKKFIIIMSIVICLIGVIMLVVMLPALLIQCSTLSDPACDRIEKESPITIEYEDGKNNYKVFEKNKDDNSKNEEEKKKAEEERKKKTGN